MMINDSEELEKLHRQLAVVTAERDKLLAENRCLRRNYSTGSQASGKVSLSPFSMKPDSLPVIGKPATGSVAINNESHLFEKVKLFHSLFRGREDVFARLWWSRKS
ncbi:hypothetical protein ACFLWI_06365 [Chloroflexota bacterium]